MCKIFHDAVVKKRDPAAWQEVIRSRNFQLISVIYFMSIQTEKEQILNFIGLVKFSRI